MPGQINRDMFKTRPSKVFARLFCWLFVEGRPLTTKGRWLNPLVFFGYRVSQIFPVRRSIVSPIYIVGSGRSGTTVLGTLFAVHRDTIFLNEPKAAWHYVYDNEDVIGSYANSKGKLRINADVFKLSMRKKLSHIYSLAARISSSERVVDKYPELIFRIPFVNAIFPEAKFVAIVRDGVDTCSSVVEWSKRNGVSQDVDTHDWWGKNDRKWYSIVEEIIPEHEDLKPLQKELFKTTNHFDRAAVEWILSTRESIIRNTSNPHLLLIKYEDLCTRTEDTLAQILDHCHLDNDKLFMGYANRKLNANRPYDQIELKDELVRPFKETLKMAGYKDSLSRVISRA